MINSKKESENNLPIFNANGFLNWYCVNDTIMGGSSDAKCLSNDEGISLNGTLIEEGGGFVSCKSPVMVNPLDLSLYKGLQLEIDGYGRTFKLAISCNRNLFRLSNFALRGVRWVALVPTDKVSTTHIRIPFKDFRPTLRAKPIPFPLSLNISSINQFQILYSKFGMPGELNSEFSPGKVSFLLRSISAFF